MRHELQNCLLRPWRAGDEASSIVHANSRDVWLNLRDQFPHPYTRENAEAWVKFASNAAQPTSSRLTLLRLTCGIGQSGPRLTHGRLRSSANCQSVAANKAPPPMCETRAPERRR
jgi:hypothetical protein